MEATVNDLIHKNDKIVGCSISFKNGEKGVQIRAPLTLIADGCFSKFRKQFVNKTPIAKSNFVGYVLFAKFRFIIKNLDLPYSNYGHVILAKPSPILLYQISSTDTRILIDVPGNLPNPVSLKKYLQSAVGPQLPESIRPKFYEAF